MKEWRSPVDNWIFVTGAPRSGTTFVGKVLTLPISVDYIHEPFNPSCGVAGIDRRFLYLKPDDTTENTRIARHAIDSVFSYSFKLPTPRYPQDGFWRRAMKKVIGGRGQVYLSIAKLNPFHRAAVIKDPIGVFLTEYIHHHYNVKPLIVVKHPLSLAASLKRLHWHPNLSLVNSQPQLVADFLQPYADLLSRRHPDPLVAASVQWIAIYRYLLQLSRRYPGWIVATHEEISENPTRLFRHFYERLSLPWSRSVERTIIRLTHSGNTDVAGNRIHDFRRNSADIFEHRRNSLTMDERRRIFEIVEGEALNLYSRESFAID